MRVGIKYGNLIILSVVGTNKHRQTLVLCKCICGKEKTIVENNLKNGTTTSCGCIRAERNKSARLIHGEAKKSKEWIAWYNMKRRCIDKNKEDYKDYGGRGIIVCDRWLHSFENFLIDMGRAPSIKHSLDRIDNNGNYDPDNCKWSTPEEQANNKRNNKKPKSSCL